MARWGRAAAVAGVLALVAAGGWQASRARPTPYATPAPTLTPPVPPPVGFDAPPLSGRTGLRLLVGGDRLLEYAVDGGRTTAVTGMPGPTSALLAVDGGTVVTGTGVQCAACAVYTVPPGAHAVRPLGRYDGAVPAAERGLIWAYRRGGAPDATGTVRLLDLAGRPRGPEYRLPATRVPVRGTVAGLLLHRVDVGQREETLWDPATGRLTQLAAQPIAASATELAFPPLGACADSCPLGRQDLRTGAYREVRVPGQPVAAAFDPSGQVLAVAAALLDRDTNPLTTVYLIRAGEMTAVASSTVHSNRVALTWSDSRLVVALLPAGGADGPLFLATATLADPQLRRIGRLPGRVLAVR
jgi:hypothetical protein